MRRAALLLHLVLAPGCTRGAAPVVTPEPVAAPVVAEPAMAVRELPEPSFADPKRREKLAAALPAIREMLARVLVAEELIGLAVGIVVDGELVLGEGLGVQSDSVGGDIDVHTAFRVGSITKLFTAMTALQLAEQGQIDLDAPAAARLPELHRLVYPARDARRLTVRDILTHSAGLPRNPDMAALTVDRAPTRDELMQAIDGLALVRAPGVTYEYSNLGFALLGHLIAATSGRPYHDTIDAAILDPLGMRETVWELSAVPAGRLASGHGFVDGRVRVVPPTQHGALDAAGGLFSTVDDLARFLGAQLAAWPPRGADELAPLRRGTLRDAHRQQVFAGFRVRGVPGEQTAVGVGMAWQVRHGCQLPHVVTHSGATDGYHATLSMVPHAGVGVIVLANAGWADTDRIADEIHHVLERGGVLAPRVPQALPQLTTAAGQVVQLLAAWDEQAFAGMSARGLGAASRQVAEQMSWLRAAVGPCALGPLRRSFSAWSGEYVLTCERGRAELTLALTSADAPKLASVGLAWIGGVPGAAVQEAATAAADLLAGHDAAKARVLLSRNLGHGAMERLFARVRAEHGVCRLGDPLEVGGPNEAIYALTCERGKPRLTIGIDRAQPPQIRTLRVGSPELASTCALE